MRSTNLRSATIPESDLVLVSRARAVTPPLSIGERAVLNSGSPIGLIVDTNHDDLTVAWPNRAETTLPRACLSRYNPRAPYLSNI